MKFSLLLIYEYLCASYFVPHVSKLYTEQQCIFSDIFWHIFTWMLCLLTNSIYILIYDMAFWLNFSFFYVHNRSALILLCDCVYGLFVFLSFCSIHRILCKKENIPTILHKCYNCLNILVSVSVSYAIKCIKYYGRQMWKRLHLRMILRISVDP